MPETTYGPATTEALSVAQRVQQVASAEAVEHVLKAVSDDFLKTVGNSEIEQDDDTGKALPLLVMAITNVQRTSMPDDEEFMEACNDLLALLTLEELRRAGLAEYSPIDDLYTRADDLTAQFMPQGGEAAGRLSARALNLWSTAVNEARAQ